LLAGWEILKTMQERRSSLKWLRGRLVIEVPAILRIPVVLDEITAYAEDAMKLTPRETQVLDGVRRCLHNREIANELNISKRTATFFVSCLLRKFGVKSRGELISKLGGTRSRATPAE